MSDQACFNMLCDCEWCRPLEALLLLLLELTAAVTSAGLIGPATPCLRATARRSLVSWKADSDGGEDEGDGAAAVGEVDLGGSGGECTREAFREGVLLAD